MISRTFINLVTAGYLLAILIVGISSYGLIYSLDGSQLPSLAAAGVKDPANKALSLALDMIKLLTSLSAGLIAVSIWLLQRPLLDEREIVERIIWSSAAIVALSASMYFGFVAQDRALAMLSFKVFDARFDLFWKPQTYQYYAFCMGALLLGLACIRSINAIRDTK